MSLFQDVSKTIGAPFSVFLSQYPFLPIGRGKNGCPVNYFLAGKINPEGILSLSTSERLQGYFWWSFMYKFKQEIRKAQERDPDFVRVEGINILDLQGLSASALSSETIDVVKLASKISDFFPEVSVPIHINVYGLLLHALAYYSKTNDTLILFFNIKKTTDASLYADYQCTRFLFHVLGSHQKIH